MSNFSSGQKVNWYCDYNTGKRLLGDLTAHGEQRVVARVIYSSEKRIRIAVYNLHKGQLQYRSVSPNSLDSRASHVPEIDDASLEQQGGQA
jgi:hypothetical protein